MPRTTALTLALAGALAAAPAVHAAPAAAPPVVDLTISDSGFAMPARITGGMVAMHIRNTGADPHEMAMGRVGRGHTARQAVAVLRRAFVTGAEPPPWIRDATGVPLMTPGADLTVTRRLAPGTYVIGDPTPDHRGRSHVTHGLIRAFRVRGDSGARPPAADAVITARRRRLDVPPIAAGTRTLELRNASGEGRGFLLASLNPGRTPADAGRWIAHIDRTGRLPAGPIPATILGAIQTIPSGTSVWVTVDLTAGRRYRIEDDESGIRAGFTPR